MGSEVNDADLDNLPKNHRHHYAEGRPERPKGGQVISVITTSTSFLNPELKQGAFSSVSQLGENRKEVVIQQQPGFSPLKEP